MLAEILSAVEKIDFQPSMVVCIFFFTFVFVCFSFCLSRVLYVHVVQGVCSWCVHVCSWRAHVYDECSGMFHIVFAC